MSVPMRRVVREWPANDAGLRAAELAKARGQLVHAERHGDVVRVVLRVPAVRTTTAPRQTPTRPRQRRWAPVLAVAGGAVAVVGALVALLWWAVLWVVDHLAVVLGVGVVLLLGAALLARLAGAFGGDRHPCNR